MRQSFSVNWTLFTYLPAVLEDASLYQRQHVCLMSEARPSHYFYIMRRGFGGLEVASWPLVPKFAVSHPAEAVGFLGRKIPQHAFLRKGSKAVDPMS
jgi:hypothetical protein